MSEQQEVAEHDFALPEWNAETREGIEKTGGKKDMLPSQAFGHYTCRLTKFRRALQTSTPGLIVEAVILESTNDLYAPNDVISFFIHHKDSSRDKELPVRKYAKIMADLGSALFASKTKDPSFNPYQELDGLAKMGRLPEEVSAQLTFKWSRTAGNPKKGFDQKTGEQRTGYYDEDSVTAA